MRKTKEIRVREPGKLTDKHQVPGDMEKVRSWENEHSSQQDFKGSGRPWYGRKSLQQGKGGS
jgi:hypothetical protein